DLVAQGVESRIRIGLDRRRRAEMGESAELLRVLRRERARQLLARRATRLERGGKRGGGFETAHPAGDLRGALRGVEPRDRPDARAPRLQALPGGRGGEPARSDRAEAGDDDATALRRRLLDHKENDWRISRRRNLRP